MTTMLQTIRTVFPEDTRTADQDMLIGSSCLTLTPDERNSICIYGNVKRALTVYQATDEDHFDSVVNRITSATQKGQIIGGVTGAVAGAAVGAAASLIATKKLNFAVAGAGAVAGGVAGVIVGAHIGGRIAKKIETDKIANSEEVQRWKHATYKMDVFPPLMQYLTPENANEVQVCPITLDWIEDEPVKAPDHYTYEKAMLLQHLAAWEEVYPAPYFGSS